MRSPASVANHETETIWYFTVEPPSLAAQRWPAFLPIKFWPSGDWGVITMISLRRCLISRPPFFGPIK